jgi:homoserine O-acetyltransferase
MKTTVSILFAIVILYVVTSYSQSIQLFAEIGNLNLVNGSKIENCVIGYRTFGKLNSDSSNAIIFPTWFEGTTNEVGRLIQKYAFLDTTKYFIIAIDALGNGVSSSPSNYNVYKIKSFPDITIRDMVNSQYVLVTKYLKLKHLFAAVGGSLGGMQVLEWSVAYPGFISKIISYVSTPKVSTYDRLWISTQLDIIENGKWYGETEQEIRKTLAKLMAAFARTPAYMIEKIKNEEFENYLKSFDKEYSSTYTLDDYYSQIKAIYQHNIYSNFNNSVEETIKQIKAKIFLIISETDLLVNPGETTKFGGLTKSKLLLLNNNCGHLAVTCEMDKCREEIAKFLMEQ